MLALGNDYAPLSDMRATSDYRLEVAKNLLYRFWLETRPNDPLPKSALDVRAVAAACARSQRQRAPDASKDTENTTMNQQAEPFLKDLQARRRRHPGPRLASARIGASARERPRHLHRRHPELAGTLHAALGLSPKAHAKLVSMSLDKVRAMPGVVAVFTAADIPGVNDCGPIIHDDDPILADGLVQYVGQPMFVVIATTHDAARRAARRAEVVYEELPAILTAQQAHAANQHVLPPMQLARGEAAAKIARAAHREAGEMLLGGQEQFYLEGQISYAIPKEDDGMHVYCSTQHPSEMQHLVAHALGLPSHNVLVECRRMGGGFGGKESQSALFACGAALAARKLQRPVKLRLDRDDDLMVTGKRHCFHYEYEVGYDDTGAILGVEVDMVSRAGFSADLSGPVMTRALCHFDNAYWLPDVAIHGFCGKTNTQSNTAFRGFGGPQGAIAIENIVDTSRARWARTRSTCAASTSTARPSATSRPTARWSTTTSSTSWSPSSRRPATTARAARRSTPSTRTARCSSAAWR